MLKLGSLFDGSGGFPLGGILAGIEPVWASEIEPFAILVTTKRLPQVKHLGNIKEINGADIDPVDIITFGSPCTDMSLAGRRAGLDGHQSVLFYDAIKVIKEMREATNGQYPRYIVWENVQGAFSSNHGADFCAVLNEICKIKDKEITIPQPKKWENAGTIMGESFSVAWRMLDAQFFGVPQRRCRIYLVADFTGQSAPKILFEQACLRGNTEESCSEREATSRSIGECAEEADKRIVLNDQGGWFMTVTEDVAGTLCCTNASPIIMDDTPKTLQIRSGGGVGGKGALVQENKSATLSTLNNQTLFAPVIDKHSIALDGNTINRIEYGKQKRGWHEEVAYTLDTGGKHSVAVSYGLAKSAYTSGYESKYGIAINEEIEPTMVAHGAGAVATPTNSLSISSNLINPEYVVRRLTPVECARLQGFPDNWCSGLETDNPTEEQIRYWQDAFENFAKAMGKNVKRKSENMIRKWLAHPNTDGAEYKLWGNGVALPCVYFVLSSINKYAGESND